MKGVIFNVVEEVVTERFGEDTWDDLLDAAKAGGAYTSLGNYEDAELVAIVGAATEALGVSQADVLRLVGELGFERLMSRYPDFQDTHKTSRSVLTALNDVIHPRVLTLYPGAKVPEFSCVEDGNRLVLEYTSDRGLCHLAEGLAMGAAKTFGDDVQIQQTLCRHLGDPSCTIVVDYGA